MAVLQIQLSEALAEIENIKAVATVSESTKQEAIDQVKQHCQEEVASLQTIMKESLGNYEAQLKATEKERAQWRQYQESKERELAKLRRQVSGNLPQDNLENDMRKAQEDAEKLRSIVMPMEQEIAALKQKLAKAEEQLSADAPHRPPQQRWDAEFLWREEASGPRRRPLRDWPPEETDTGSAAQGGADTFADNCASCSTGAGPAPCAGRTLPPGQEDSISLLSTGTLVPESIYLPPAGHQLLLDEEWAELQQEVKQHQVSLHQTREQLEREIAVRQDLEEALRRSTEDCGKEVSRLKEEMDSSARELHKIQQMFMEAQQRTQKQVAELMETHKALCQRLRQLQTENQSLKGQAGLHSLAEDSQPPTSSAQALLLPRDLKAAAQDESRQRDTALQFTLISEGSHTQDGRSELLTGLQEKMVEVDTLQALCSRQSQQLQAAIEEKADLTLRLREEKSKGQRLQVELDTSEQVQRDFVKLSQALQVRLEQIRQADSMEVIRRILDSVTNLRDASQLKGAWDQGS